MNDDQTTAVRISRDVHDQLRIMAAHTRRKMREIVESALKLYITPAKKERSK